MSIIKDIGFTISVYSKFGGSFIRSIRNFKSYNHHIDAVGGFGPAGVSFPATMSELQEWYEFGLMRHVSVEDSSGIVYEGFVNEITINYSSRKITVGPATDLANRVAAIYTPVVYASGGVVRGGQTQTALNNYARSQDNWGIFHKIVNVGECTDAEALQARNIFGSEMSFPQRSESLDTSNPGDISIDLKMDGYSELLNSNPYSNTSTTPITYSAFISALVAAYPNVYMGGTKYISTNAATIVPLNDGSRAIGDIIKGVCALGDVSSNRWTFGIYENGLIYYSAIPSSEKYTYKLSDGVKSLALAGGTNRVFPWQIRPAALLRYVDFPLFGRLWGTALLADPQLVFIESVDYRAPFSLTVNGGRVNTLSQKIAQLGLRSR